MPELRHDPVQSRWVIISSERGQRPMDLGGPPASGSFESAATCPFCAGREGQTPPDILRFNGHDGRWLVRVVANRYPALRIEGTADRAAVGQYDRMNGIGAHEVIIETPEHDKGFADLSAEHMALVLKAYRERILDLKKDKRFRYVIIFKNSGRKAGASLHHAHTQVMATPITPRTVSMELNSARNHFALKERCIFCDMITQELETAERIVRLDDDFMTHCPYASRFPFEMHIHPRRHMYAYSSMDDGMLLRLAFHFKDVLRRMNAALDNPSYNFLIHTAPAVEGRDQRANYWSTLEQDWHWHIEILPRITNVAGFEWGTGFYINPTPPEDAARFLREVDL